MNALARFYPLAVATAAFTIVMACSQREQPAGPTEVPAGNGNGTLVATGISPAQPPWGGIAPVTYGPGGSGGSGSSGSGSGSGGSGGSGGGAGGGSGGGGSTTTSCPAKTVIRFQPSEAETIPDGGTLSGVVSGEEFSSNCRIESVLRFSVGITGDVARESFSLFVDTTASPLVNLFSTPVSVTNFGSGCGTLNFTDTAATAYDGQSSGGTFMPLSPLSALEGFGPFGTHIHTSFSPGKGSLLLHCWELEVTLKAS